MSTSTRPRVVSDQLSIGSNEAHGGCGRFFESLCDRVIAGLILFATLPLMSFVALAIWSEGQGPVFCREERSGRAGRRFLARKFRTTVVAPGTVMRAGTVKLSRVGRVLRFTRID
jgi:lipopolysaccharide/colanic/teichoic acid biosynthesis glycosyltransferase